MNLLKQTQGDRFTKRRGSVARARERATVPERRFRHGLPYLVQPEVTAACAACFLAMAAALRDETHPVDDRILREVSRFITDGRSSFFGRDASEAARVAARLHQLVATGAGRHSSGAPVRRDSVKAQERTAVLTFRPALGFAP